jgi:hypothetical protein
MKESYTQRIERKDLERLLRRENLTIRENDNCKLDFIVFDDQKIYSDDILIN